MKVLLPEVKTFFDETTNTFSYVVKDPTGNSCAILDSVLDFDYASGAINFISANKIIDYIREYNLNVEWILETHAHADHLSAAPYLQDYLGGKIAIGKNITIVQNTFGKVFNAGTIFKRDGSQFDHLFSDNEEFNIGNLVVKVLYTPGHTPACVSYLVGDSIFVGDTLFMPDYGTARCDFPGGDAAVLYQSIQKIFTLPDDTKIFLCHDYLPQGRSEYKNQTTVGEERLYNVQVNQSISEFDFVSMRNNRDRTLSMPKLIIPSIQVNMRAGNMPPPEDDGEIYLKIPINKF